MKQQPDVWAFLREFVQRLGTKNPAFFNVIAWIGAIAAFVTGLPALIESLGVNLPEWWVNLQNKAVAWAGVVTIIISNLAVQRPVVTETPQGTVTVTDKDKLPFTAKKEEQSVSK